MLSVTESNKAFVRSHFEDFVNQKDLSAADRNFTADFQDHGTDTPEGLRFGPNGPKQYLAAAFLRFPDIYVTIDDMLAEGDKVMVRNTWRATEGATGLKVQFSGVVIWRIRDGQLCERWAYLESPHPVH